jgi:nucleotidyltransferase substrate binding protein (TIGR01987 family)
MTGAIRWRHRFQDYDKAFLLLKRSLTIETPTEVERGGIIHFYEMAFELAWKLMKDYLERQGFTVNSPRDAIKQAFNATILEDDQLWYASLEDRSLRTLTYDEKKAIDVVAKIRSQYFQKLEQLHDYMQSEL